MKRGFGDSIADAQDPGTQPPPPRASPEALLFLMATLTLIGAPECHSGLQTGIYPAEVSEERLNLLAGRLALLWNPGMNIAGHQQALPAIWSTRQEH